VAVVANVAINVDSRGAAQKLRQFQQQSTAAGRAAEQLQGATGKVGREMQTAANGMRFFIDAAGRARKENGQFVTTAEAAAAGLKKQGQAADEAGRSMSRLERIMAQLATTVGAAGIGRFAAGITRTAATFEGELRKAAAIEGGGNFDKLRGDIERVAAAAAGTPTQVAALATALSRAGFTAEETGQSLQGIVRGAEATGLSFEQMGSITSDAMRSFGIETSKTESVIDVLVKTANSSNQTVQDLGEALKYAAPIARSLGVNITDLSATMGILANNGIRGSEAGTALRTGLAKLQLAASASNGELLDLLSGNKQLADSMKALGVSVTDASGKLKPLDDVLINLKRGLEGLGPGVQAEVLQALFGEEAGGKLRAALNSTEEDIRKMFGAIREGAGAAAETQKQMQGFSYTMDVLGGNVEIVSNQIGDKFIAVLQPMIQGLNDAFAASQRLPKPLRDVASGAAAVGIAVGGVALAVKTLIPLVTTLSGLLGIGGLGGLIAAGPWIALAAGVAAVAGSFILAAQEKARLDDVMTSGSAAQLAQEIQRVKSEIEEAEKKTAGYQNELRGVGNQSGYASVEIKKLKELLANLEGEYKVRINIEQEVQGMFAGQGRLTRSLVQQGYGRGEGGALTYTVAGVTYDAKTGRPTVAAPQAITPPKSPGAGRKGKTDAEKAAERAAKEEARIQARIRGLQIETQATQQLAVLRGRIAEAEMAGNEELAIRLRGVEREQQILVQYQQSIGDVTERVRQAMEAKALADLEMVGMETAIDLEKQRLKLLKEQNDEFFKRAGLTPQDKMPSGAGAFDPSLPDLRVSPAEQQMAAYRAELDALTNPINMAVTGANAIGDAFGQAFQDIATGAKSTEQALADTFKAIGEAFISMAVQIIAKQIAMITFQTLLKALGGGGGSFGFSGAGPYQLPGGGGFAQGFSLPKLNATGSMVTGPTNAIIGEAGPEAVMPLQRGTDGKMGVQIADNRAFLDSLTTGFTAAIDEASDDPAAAATDNRASLREVERLQENRTQIMTQQMEAERRYERERIEQMASTPGNLNIKYQSQVINSVEYVTRDQAERMAAQSALRGRELAIGALQNSVKTRKRVGI